MPPLDLALFHALNADAFTAPTVVTTARWASQQLPIAMGGVLAGCGVVGSSEQRRELARVLLSMALAWVGVQLLRYAIPAPRPAQLGIGMQWVEHAARPGFPSMHAAGAFALAASLQFSRRTRSLALLGWAAAIAIAWSRVCLGVHFPSDVLAGMLTGTLTAWAVHALSTETARLRDSLHNALRSVIARVRQAIPSWRRRFSAYWSRQVPPSAPHR